VKRELIRPIFEQVFSALDEGKLKKFKIVKPEYFQRPRIIHLAQELKGSKNFPHAIHQLAWMSEIEIRFTLNLFDVTY
jgi:hypothetical protein